VDPTQPEAAQTKKKKNRNKKNKAQEVKVDFTGGQEEDQAAGADKDPEGKAGGQAQQKKQSKKKPAKAVRQVKEVEGAYYDEMGFYILPDNKGFYDPDGFLFDEKGFDQFGGYYDNDGLYHPGEANKHEFPDYKKPEDTRKDSDHRRGGE
jgi:hypothetical protein